jgi:hypothetical protein
MTRALETDRPIRRALALLAACLLLFAQLLLALHQLDHLDEQPAELHCDLCAVAAGHGAPLPASPLAIATAGVLVGVTPPRIQAAPLLRPFRAQTQRAPPAPLRSIA